MTYQEAALYKRMILYLMRTASAPLSNSRIVGFFLEGEYTDYFTIQEELHDLLADRQISAEERTQGTFYALTEDGRTSCLALEGTLDAGIRDDVRSYLEKYAIAIREEASYRTSLTRRLDGSYLVRLETIERGEVIFAVELALEDREEAQELLSSWASLSSSVYRSVISSINSR